MADSITPKLAVECLGTFFLCFTVALSAGQVASLAGIAIGSALMCAIYFGGHISGANYNPAVSLGLLIRGVLQPKDFIMYVIAQLTGATLAAGIVLPIAASSDLFPLGVIGHPAIAAKDSSGTISALLAEIVLTFALVHVVLHTATTTYSEGKSYYGLAIGFTVASGAISVGGVSGGAFNPAVGMLTLFSDDKPNTSYESIWIYWVGPLLGGTLAGILFRATHPHEVRDVPDSLLHPCPRHPF